MSRLRKGQVHARHVQVLPRAIGAGERAGRFATSRRSPAPHAILSRRRGAAATAGCSGTLCAVADDDRVEFGPDHCLCLQRLMTVFPVALPPSFPAPIIHRPLRRPFPLPLLSLSLSLSVYFSPPVRPLFVHSSTVLARRPHPSTWRHLDYYYYTLRLFVPPFVGA